MGAQTSSSGEPPSIVITQSRQSPDKITSPSQVQEGGEMDCPRNLEFESPINECRVEQGLAITQESPGGKNDEGCGVVARAKRRFNNRDPDLRREGRRMRRRIDDDDDMLNILRNPPKPKGLRF